MNRIIKLPPPPSKRDRGDRRPDWPAQIREFVGHLVNVLVVDGMTEGAAIRRRAIGFAREALGDADTATLIERTRTATTRAGDYSQAHKNLDGMPGLLRLIVQDNVPDWSEPLAVETVMAEYQRALDDEFRRRLDHGTRAMARLEWKHLGEPRRGERGEVLARVVDYARAAIRGGLDAEAREVGAAGEVYASPIGFLRSIVTAFDLANADVAGSLLEIVERAARAELGRPIPGAGLLG